MSNMNCKDRNNLRQVGARKIKTQKKKIHRKIERNRQVARQHEAGEKQRNGDGITHDFIFAREFSIVLPSPNRAPWRIHYASVEIADRPCAVRAAYDPDQRSQTVRRIARDVEFGNPRILSRRNDRYRIVLEQLSVI